MFEAGNEYQTRDGRRARVYATDGGGVDVFHGAIHHDGGWRMVCWEADGRLCSSSTNPGDLIPPRPPVVVSSAVLEAWRSGYWAHARPNIHADNAVRDGIAAAITAYLAEQEAR